MSGIINKVKDAISGHHDESKDHAGHTAGPHNTDTANRVDPRVDSNQTGYGNTTQTGTHGTSGLGSSEYGSTGTGYGNTGTTTTAGPHNSNIANKADPRVDSDLDGSRTAGGNTGYGTTGTGSSTLGSGTTGSTGYGSSNTTGPHNSNIANKLDPRVDSQTGRVDITNTHQGRTGNYDDYTSNTTGTGTQGSSTLGGSGYGQSGTTGYGSSTTGTGPHNSNIANKLDPRVDSTTGQQTGTGYGSTGQQTGTGYGTTGQQTGTGYDSTTGVNQGTHGHHHGHHKAEEAGVVGAAAYGAEHEHNKHQHGNTGYDSTTGVNQGTHEHHHGHHGNHRAEEAGVAGTAAYGAEHERKLPHDSGAGGLASKISPLGSSTVGGTKREGEYTNTGSASTAYERNALGGFSDGAGGTAGHGYSDTNFGEATRGQQNTRDDMGQTSSSTGPHSSNLLNKLDPRVKNDSENTTNTGRYDNKDTFDAAQVPPSQFQRDPHHSFSTQGSKSGGGII